MLAVSAPWLCTSLSGISISLTELIKGGLIQSNLCCIIACKSHALCLQGRMLGIFTFPFSMGSPPVSESLDMAGCLSVCSPGGAEAIVSRKHQRLSCSWRSSTWCNIKASCSRDKPSQFAHLKTNAAFKGELRNNSASLPAAWSRVNPVPVPRG